MKSPTFFVTAMKTKPERPDLVSVLQSSTAEDKEQVDARIDELSRELETLRIVQKLLDVKLNGKPARKVPQKRAAKAPAVDRSSSNRDRVYDYLQAQGRPVKAMIIAADCEIPSGSISSVLTHEWFTKTPDGYEIAKSA